MDDPQDQISKSEQQKNDGISTQERMLAAIEARRKSTNQSHGQLTQYDDEKDLRQEFRLLIDPGIMRPSRKEVALTSLKTLSTIAENLLREPDNEKFQRFKPTNTIIKQRLVDVPGALEYAIAMGFRAEVEDFQPFYVHARGRRKELHVGSRILSEAIALENEKARRDEEIRAKEKSAKESLSNKVKMNFEDDRRERQLRDLMERERRNAKANTQRHVSEADSSHNLSLFQAANSNGKLTLVADKPDRAHDSSEDET